MRNKRLKSFTLVEMIVVMLLTAVVVGMAYEVFQVVSKSYNSFSVKSERINDVERLEHWLSRDFLRAEAISASGHELCMLMGKDTVYYRFADSMITRQGRRVDAIRVSNEGFVTAFLGKPLEYEKRSLPADQLNFKIILEKQEIPESFYKLYSAAQLINLTNGLDRHP
jgi:Tfp pilus assembly protein PilE